jgi:hypothetical protein
MRRQVRGALAALTVVGLALAASAPAAATSGSQRFDGVIVTSGASGARTVLASPVVARGALNAVGRIVEVDNLPGDSDDISRDDVVFPGGTMHLVSTTLDVAFSINPRTCVFRVTLQQTGQITGGTGRFAHAAGSSTATVGVTGLAARNSDGSCSEERAPLAEVDTITSTGTLSY